MVLHAHRHICFVAMEDPNLCAVESDGRERATCTMCGDRLELVAENWSNSAISSLKWRLTNERRKPPTAKMCRRCTIPNETPEYCLDCGKRVSFDTHTIVGNMAPAQKQHHHGKRRCRSCAAAQHDNRCWAGCWAGCWRACSSKL